MISSSIQLLLFTRALEKTRNRLVIHSRMCQFVNFQLDKESRSPLDVSPTITIEANKVIENMMLLANQYAAETIHKKHGNNAVLRIHPGLNVEDLFKRLEQLETIVQNQGLLEIIKELKGKSVSRRSGDISQLLAQVESTELKIFFSGLLSMNMSPAEYRAPKMIENIGPDTLRHFALNLDFYTHARFFLILLKSFFKCHLYF